ncbi:MAG: hypothetical protein P9X26_09415 [Candidatus Stygibacter frigidus]|nr:hypothetical protein [Candidatus Stygibacter frigidus]
MDKKKGEILDALLLIEEIKLKAQLKAIRKLSNFQPKENVVKPKGMSQVDMVYNILIKEDRALHITSIIEKVESAYRVLLDRESIVSALTKKVKKNDRFLRVDKNTFTVIKSKERKNELS